MRKLISILTLAAGVSLGAVAANVFTFPPSGGGSDFLAQWDRRHRLVEPGARFSRRGESQDYTRAAAELKKAIVTGVGGADLQYRLGFCYEKMGDYDHALEAYGRAARYLAGSGGDSSRFPGAGGGTDRSLEPLLDYHMGIVLAKKGRFAEAARHLEKRLSSGPPDAALLNNLGYCYRNLFMKRRALEIFSRAADMDAERPEIYLNRGITHAELGELDAAERDLRKALDLRPEIPEARRTLALVLSARGGAGEEVPVSVAGSAAANRGEIETTGTPCPTKPAQPVRLSGGEGKAGGEEETDPQRAELDRARELEAKGEGARAEKIYARIVEEDPRCAEAYLGLARLAELEGGDDIRRGGGFQAEKSIAFYERALKLRPDDAAVWFSFGRVCERGGMYGRAAAAFGRARELDPEMAMAVYHLGICNGKLGRMDAAENNFRDAVALDPLLGAAHFQLGRLYTGRRDYRKAIEAYETVLRLNPGDADAHFNLAQIYRVNLPEPDKAREHYRCYLNLAPDAADAPRVLKWVNELKKNNVQ